MTRAELQALAIRGVPIVVKNIDCPACGRRNPLISPPQMSPGDKITTECPCGHTIHFRYWMPVIS